MCSPRTPLQARQSGFSLVEVVLVIGIVAFALIPLIGSLAVAHDTSRAAQENMDVALVFQSTRSIVEKMEPATRRSGLNAAGFEYFFTQGGRFLGSNAADDQVHYRVRVIPDAAGSSPDLARVVLRAEYPAPSFATRTETPATLFYYGSR